MHLNAFECSQNKLFKWIVWLAEDLCKGTGLKGCTVLCFWSVTQIDFLLALLIIFVHYFCSWLITANYWWKPVQEIGTVRPRLWIITYDSFVVWFLESLDCECLLAISRESRFSRNSPFWCCRHPKHPWSDTAESPNWMEIKFKSWSFARGIVSSHCRMRQAMKILANLSFRFRMFLPNCFWLYRDTVG